jgi:hypothetical protein
LCLKKKKKKEKVSEMKGCEELRKEKVKKKREREKERNKVKRTEIKYICLMNRLVNSKFYI